MTKKYILREYSFGDIVSFYNDIKKADSTSTLSDDDVLNKKEIENLISIASPQKFYSARRIRINGDLKLNTDGLSDSFTITPAAVNLSTKMRDGVYLHRNSDSTNGNCSATINADNEINVSAQLAADTNTWIGVSFDFIANSSSMNNLSVQEWYSDLPAATTLVDLFFSVEIKSNLEVNDYDLFLSFGRRKDSDNNALSNTDRDIVRLYINNATKTISNSEYIKYVIKLSFNNYQELALPDDEVLVCGVFAQRTASTWKNFNISIRNARLDTIDNTLIDWEDEPTDLIYEGDV